MNDNSNQNPFYSDDVNAQAISDNQQDPDDLKIKDEVPVTTGEMEIGDMDDDPMLNTGDDKASYDEETVPGSDN